MPVLKRRNRVVNFRLSESEYGKLKDFCVTQEARCISDVARSALLHFIEGGDHVQDIPPSRTIRKVTSRVKKLEGEVKRLARLVDGESGSNPPEAAEAVESRGPSSGWRNH